jgi:hypothetical protein
VICAPNACDFVPQTFRAHCKSVCCFHTFSSIIAILHFVVVRTILALCTILRILHVLHSIFVPALQCIFTCALSLHSVLFAYDIIFIHLAFAAFCVCIIRLHSRHIQHMSHSSSVAFKGPSAFICISCPFPASFSRGDAGPSLA